MAFLAVAALSLFKASFFKESLFKAVTAHKERPLTLILLQKYRATNGRRIVIQIGGVCTTFCQEGGILLQKYRDRNGRCIAILFKSIGVRGQFDAPDSMMDLSVTSSVQRGRVAGRCVTVDG